MNYFELHIGDLTEATAHLSMIEDGAYGRLLRKYYATEKPLPADIKLVQRLVGARTKEERDAVDTVLKEFFELQDDGWHQSRCDAEIAVFHEKQIGSAGKRESAKERQRRARERRAQLFDELRTLGVVAPWTTKTNELEAMLSRVTGAQQVCVVTPPVTRDDTATHTPDTKHQSPNTNLQTPDSSVVSNSSAPTPDGADTVAASPPKVAKPPKAKTPALTAGVWTAYSEAYALRYGAEPVRNLKVNAQLSQVVQRLGADESPGVARFYVGHQNALYVRAMHPVDLLLRDAEKLRTEWVTNTQTTNAAAIAADRTRTNLNAFAPLLAEAQAREVAHGDH